MNHEGAVKSRAAERYILSEMQTSERDAFEEHYFECEACADDVRALATFVENAKAVLAEPTEPLPLREGGREPTRERASGFWLGWLRPQLAMAGLAALFAVALPLQFSTVQRLKAPRLTEAAVLHGVSRGEVPAVRKGEPLLLLIALEEPIQGGDVAAEIRGADGSVKHRIGAALKASEGGLSLYVPEPRLDPGRYTVVIGKTQYPFEVR